MRTTWEKLVHHVGKIHGHDISNKLLNKKRVTIDKHEHTQDALDEHQFDTERRDRSYKRLYEYRQSHKGIYEEQLMQGESDIAANAKMYFSNLNNEIVEEEYKSHHILPIVQ